MKWIVIFTVLAYLVSAQHKQSCMTELTEKLYNTKVKDSRKLWLIKFCVSWVDYCKALDVVWEKLSPYYCNKENIEIATVNIDKETELKYMFDVATVPKTIIIKNGKYYVLDKKVRGVEDLTVFINNGYLQYPAFPLPERKSTLSKLLFLNKAAIDLAVYYLDTFGLESLPYWSKVLIVVGLLLAPFVAVFAWALMPHKGPKVSPYRKKEIFETMRERIRMRKQVQEYEEEYNSDNEEMQGLKPVDTDKNK